MNKFSKLLVTAAILPGMVDAPIALANDLEEIHETISGKVQPLDGLLSTNVKSVTLPDAMRAETIDDIMPDKKLQKYIAEHWHYQVDELTPELLNKLSLYVKYSDSFARETFFSAESYLGLEQMSNAQRVIYFDIYNEETANYLYEHPFNYEKLRFLKDIYPYFHIGGGGDLMAIFPDGIDVSDELFQFYRNTGGAYGSSYRPISVNLDNENFESFLVSYEDIGLIGSSNDTYRNINETTVMSLGTAKNGEELTYTAVPTAEGVQFTLTSDTVYDDVAGLKLESHAEYQDYGGTPGYMPTGPYLTTIYQGYNRINSPLNITFAKNAADVTVKHVEKDTGIELPGSYSLHGNVGDAIKSDPLDFDGYTFLETEWPNEATTDDGAPAFTENPQTVTHYYTKDPVESADVTISYEDEHGNAIPGYNVKTENGIIGETLECAAESIAGYTFKEVKINGDVSIDPDVKVTYTDKPQTITFVYVMNPVAEPEEGKVTVNFVDEDGNTIAKSDSQIGLVGNAYTTSPKTIKGYTFKEVKGQATGTYIHDEVTVTYVYSKNASDTIVPPVNSNDNQNDSTVVPPVNNESEKATARSANNGMTLTSPVQAESLPYVAQNGEHPELPETHADHKVTLTVVGLLTALVIGMMSVIRPKKN